jgi:hypothetical protein
MMGLRHLRKIHTARLLDPVKFSKIIALAVPELVPPEPIHLFSHDLKLLLCRLKYVKTLYNQTSTMSS